MTDHVNNALGCVGYANVHIQTAPELAANFIGEAQVHATLALVEQQRIANLIALSQVVAGNGTARPFNYHVMIPTGEYGVGLNPDIAQALGIPVHHD